MSLKRRRMRQLRCAQLVVFRADKFDKLLEAKDISGVY